MSKTLLTDKQKEFCTIIALGCDHVTACKYLGWSSDKLRQELKGDVGFAKQLARAEATSELNHMRNLRNAAKDEKHWRASVWWLERQSPERYGRRVPGSLSADQIREIIEQLADVVADGISNSTEREQILTQLAEIGLGVPSEEPASIEDDVRVVESES